MGALFSSMPWGGGPLDSGGKVTQWVRRSCVRNPATATTPSPELCLSFLVAFGFILRWQPSSLCFKTVRATDGHSDQHKPVDAVRAPVAEPSTSSTLVHHPQEPLPRLFPVFLLTKTGKILQFFLCAWSLLLALTLGLRAGAR